MYNRSCQLYEEACALLPGGVNSPVRACKNVDSIPLFIARAYAGHLVDADGNDYIDFVLSWGPMLLGHTDPSVTGALAAALARGTSYGAPCPAEIELAREIVDGKRGHARAGRGQE